MPIIFRGLSTARQVVLGIGILWICGLAVVQLTIALGIYDPVEADNWSSLAKFQKAMAIEVLIPFCLCVGALWQRGRQEESCRLD